MKLTVIFSILALGAAAHSQDFERSGQNLICQSLQGSEITQLTLKPLSGGDYRGELAVFSRFSHVPYPPLVTETFPLVKKICGAFIDDNGTFELNMPASGAYLVINGHYIDVTCKPEQDVKAQEGENETRF